jgi:hypothetical protein
MINCDEICALLNRDESEWHGDEILLAKAIIRQLLNQLNVGV